MKNLKLITFFIIHSSLFILFSGCHPAPQTPEPTSPAVHAVWESDPGKNHWKLTLLDNGTLSQVVRPDGMVMNLSEGGKEIGLGKIVTRYIYGECSWLYNETSGSLQVVLSQDSFFRTENAEVGSTISDTLQGILSEDKKTWLATWTSIEQMHQAKEKHVAEKKILFRKIQ